MEVYGGVDLQSGELMEVEFRTSGKVRVVGVVRNRSGFCFGLEFCAVRKGPEQAEDTLLATQEAYLREIQKKINRSLQAVLEKRSHGEIEAFASPLGDWP